MDIRLQTFYFSEVESQRLNVETDPEYGRLYAVLADHFDQLRQTRDHRDCSALWDEFIQLMDHSDMLCFAYGFRLGLNLAAWAQGCSLTQR